MTGDFYTSGSEGEFTLEGRWYADKEIQAGGRVAQPPPRGGLPFSALQAVKKPYRYVFLQFSGDRKCISKC